MFMQPSEWRKSFENKTDSELAAMQVPPDLPLWYANMWRRDRDEALARSGSSQPVADIQEDITEDDENEDGQNDEDKNDGGIPLVEKLAFEAALSTLENDGLPPPRDAAREPAQPLEIPKGNVADLLEHQIGMCSALIENIANYVAQNETATDVCFPFMDRISSMLSSSAAAARVVGQLRGIAAETKQTFVKKVEGAREGGVPQT